MRAFLVFALAVSFAALGACDSGTVTEPPEEEEEELVPVNFEFRIDAPSDIADFGIRYTNEEGAEVVVPTQAPFGFPFVEITDALAVEARGDYSVRIFGFLSSGGVIARVRAYRDGLLVAEEQVTAAAPAGGGQVDLTATLTIVEDGTINGR